MMDVSNDSITSSPKERTHGPEVAKAEGRSNIDPALSGVSSPSDSGDGARDRAEEAWIENIRVIEALRKLISDRLERKEYDDDGDVAMGGVGDDRQVKSTAEKSSETLYPVLRAED